MNATNHALPAGVAIHHGNKQLIAAALVEIISLLILSITFRKGVLQLMFHKPTNLSFIKHCELQLSLLDVEL